jgi:hypothetical protein
VKRVLKGPFALQSRKSYQYLPRDGERVEEAYPFRSCAVVGNSGALRHMNLGGTIDRHDVILRLNQAPTGPYHKAVGMRSTFRMMNRLWSAHYGSGRFVDMNLPLERGVTIIVSRTDGKAFEKMHKTIKAVRPDVAILYLNSRVSAARKLMVSKLALNNLINLIKLVQSTRRPHTRTMCCSNIIRQDPHYAYLPHLSAR